MKRVDMVFLEKGICPQKKSKMREKTNVPISPSLQNGGILYCHLVLLGSQLSITPRIVLG